MNEDCLREITSFFTRTGRTMTENNRKQAMLPEGCLVLHNPNGTAPGCIIEGNGKAAVLMPGPPREMRPMFDGPVRDYLTGHTDSVLVSRVLNLFGAGESFVEDRLRTMMTQSTNPTVAPYAKTSELQLRVTARAKTPEEGYRLIEPVVARIREIFPENVYGLDYASLQQAVVRELTQKGQTLAVAESCTGGLVAARLVEIPGSSAVFGCGVVAYANEAKEKLLGVRAETLARFGAVSRECALEMARGVRAVSGAEIGVSTTGVAGPDGGSDDKPVGLVYVAAVSDRGEAVRELHLARGRADDRETIRSSATANALHMALLASR
ncbi:MAG: CinA family nicotinamide mononucleotide deamidase-related protein [Oscillospiraceae bacterium]